MSRPLRSLRLLRRSAASLDNLSANSGEIFYDADNRTLRLFTGVGNDRSILATRSWTRQYVEDNTFSGNYNELTNLPSIPTDTTDLTNSAGFITQADVEQAVLGVDLTGLATEDYVDTAISNIDISAVDLTGLATEDYVDTAIGNIDIPTVDLSSYAPLANPAFTESVGIGGIASVIQGTLKTGTYLDVKGFIQINANNQNSTIDFTNFQNYRSANIESGQAGELGGPYLAINLSNSNTSSSLNNTARFTSAGTSTTSTTTGALVVEGGVGISGGITIGGLTTLQQNTEVLNTLTSATGTVTHNFSTGAIWYHSSISANFTANFTNVPTTDNRTIVVTLVLSQGATAYIPNAVQIDGAAQTIKWLGGTTPTGNSNKVDIVSFTLIRTGAAWAQVLGSLTSFG